jgi:hypothetical protein
MVQTSRSIGCDEALLHVVLIRQTQMLGGGDITEKIDAVFDEAGMVAVGGDGYPTGRDPAEEIVRMDRFGGKHLLHLFGNAALPGGRHLGGKGHGKVLLLRINKDQDTFMVLSVGLSFHPLCGLGG